jgi:hypothetical protein
VLLVVLALLSTHSEGGESGRQGRDEEAEDSGGVARRESGPIGGGSGIALIVLVLYGWYAASGAD